VVGEMLSGVLQAQYAHALVLAVRVFTNGQAILCIFRDAQQMSPMEVNQVKSLDQIVCPVTSSLCWGGGGGQLHFPPVC